MKQYVFTEQVQQQTNKTGTALSFYFQNYAEMNKIKKLNQHKPFDRMTVDIAEFIINYFKGRFVVKMITLSCVYMQQQKTCLTFNCTCVE